MIVHTLEEALCSSHRTEEDECHRFACLIQLISADRVMSLVPPITRVKAKGNTTQAERSSSHRTFQVFPQMSHSKPGPDSEE